MKLKLCQLAIVATVFGVATPSAFAYHTPPVECQTGRNARLYEAGVMKGENFAEQAWGSSRVRRDCDLVVPYRDTVRWIVRSVAASVGPAPTDGAMCHLSGTISGIYSRTHDIQLECRDTCILDGWFTGQVAADIYCELSILLGGLDRVGHFIPGPVSYCGTHFERSCRAAFRSETRSYTTFFGDTCLPYTPYDWPPSPFIPVYNQTLHNQCTYNPL